MKVAVQIGATSTYLHTGISVEDKLAAAGLIRFRSLWGYYTAFLGR
jgi:hypothetical protein